MTEKPEEDPRQGNQYLKYSGMALQFFVLVGAGAWIGQLLDKRLQTSKPYYTILLILVFASVFFYRLIKDLNHTDEP